MFLAKTYQCCIDTTVSVYVDKHNNDAVMVRALGHHGGGVWDNAFFLTPANNVDLILSKHDIMC